MAEKLDGYDWEEVFKYASGRAGVPFLAVPPTDAAKDVAQPAFGLDDVARVIASVDGENDGPDWIAVVELRDGRFGVVSAGCDYTGWG